MASAGDTTLLLYFRLVCIFPHSAIDLKQEMPEDKA
jgi:hypothetical protein